MSTSLITFLPWDSAHFGFRIARAALSQLNSNACRQLEAACREHAIDCLYFLANAGDQDTVFALLAGGFDFVDIRLTFAGLARSIPAAMLTEDIVYRLAGENDLEPLMHIARHSYTHSRFFVDWRFGGEKASQLYETWLQKSIATSYADAVVVAEMDRLPVGFVTCHLHKPDGEGNLGLVGVAESARGVGCAGGMIRYAACWFREQGLDRINVVTQGRNVSAQNLYQRCGFLTRSVDLWFHKWFEQRI